MPLRISLVEDFTFCSKTHQAFCLHKLKTHPKIACSVFQKTERYGTSDKLLNIYISIT